MAVTTKICGVDTVTAVQAAVSGGAAFVGFIFYPPSPRHVTPQQALTLAAQIPSSVGKVGVFVDPTDADLDSTAGTLPLTMVQLHGSEDAERVDAIRAQTGLPVMKAIQVAEARDLGQAAAFESVADWLLFDAKPPRNMVSALPGGNALSFDWNLLRGHTKTFPWMLSGGLTPENVAEAVRATGARTVDVSSGVEDAPGVKNPDKIRSFLDVTRSL